MAQINLLKQSTGPKDYKQITNKVLVWVFLAVFVGLIGYYGYLFFQSYQYSSQTTQIQAKITSDNAAALAVPGREELLTRQLQIKTLQSLIASHLYWSQIFAPLACVTLKKASYSSLKVGQGQDMILTTTVPDLNSLDEYEQVFNYPEFNKYFYNIDIEGFSKIQEQNSSAIQFVVDMQFDPSLAQYSSTPFSCNQ